MAQDGTTAGGSSYTIDNVTFPVGRTKLQSIFDAIRSTNIGNTAPDLVAGQFWIDNNTPSTTVWTLYFYDGTDNISFATIDTINNTVNFLDSTFDLINDTTPQLGGNLDLNSNDITGTGNINITGSITSSGSFYSNGGNINSGNSLRFNRIGTQTSGLHWYQTNNNEKEAEIEFSNTENIMITNLTSNNIYLRTNDAPRVAIQGNGDIHFYEDTGTTPKFVWDSSTESLGIGVSSPEGKLHIQEDNVGTPSTDADDLVIEKTVDTGLSILSTTTGRIFFGDASDNNVGGIVYVHTDDSMRFTNNASESMRITSDGDVLVSKTAIDTTNGVELRSTGKTVIRVASDNPLTLDRKTNEGTMISFNRNSTETAKIATVDSGNLAIGAGTAGILFNPTENHIRGFNLTAFSSSDNTIDIGRSATRFKDLYLGGGLYVGGTGSANKLDDYEEGTFTPTIIGTTTAGTFTPNNTYTRGRYTKVGRLVQVYFCLVYSSFTGTGNIKLGGLPFASEDTFMELPPTIHATGITKPSNSAIMGRLTRNSTEVNILTYDTSSTIMQRTALAVDTAGEFYFSINYHTG